MWALLQCVVVVASVVACCDGDDDGVAAAGDDGLVWFDGEEAVPAAGPDRCSFRLRHYPARNGRDIDGP